VTRVTPTLAVTRLDSGVTGLLHISRVPLPQGMELDAYLPVGAVMACRVSEVRPYAQPPPWRCLDGRLTPSGG